MPIAEDSAGGSPVPIPTNLTTNLTGEATGSGTLDYTTGDIDIAVTVVDNGHNHILSNITDVQVNNAISGQILVYNGTVWANATNTSGITAIVQDTSPQLGGNLDLNGKNINGNGNINLADNYKLTLGTGNDLELSHDGVSSYIRDVGAGDLQIFASDDVYIINLSRARYKEKMDAGNWSLKISGSKSEAVLIDDSGKKFSDTVGKAGRVFDVVSGSLNLGTEAEATIGGRYDANGRGFGKFYPDQGIIVLNPSALSEQYGLTTTGGDLSGSDSITVEGQNHKHLWNGIAGGGDFQARRTENVSTSHYFVRATNREFNFSNNPTYTTGSDGSFAESTFERDPKSFITTIGLFSDSNEMIAVAKTSQPIPKSFDKEVLIKVKLDF